MLSFDYLDYARSDVRATWECYCVLRAKYRSYGLNAPVTDILSEASIGKSALETIGIKPWLKVHPGGLDPAQTSLTLSTYFGGRTETRTRRKMVRVIHTDFTSMYPTVCTAQKLWPFVIGEGFTQKDATPEIRAFVETATPEDFQRLENWPKLTALVRIKPDRDLVPIRAAYPGQKHDTISLRALFPSFTSSPPIMQCRSSTSQIDGTASSVRERMGSSAECPLPRTTEIFGQI